MLTENNTVILACGSMRLHVDAAQEKMKTDFPVVELNKTYHVDPEKMRNSIQVTLDSLSSQVENILVSMAYCGGSWEGIQTTRRIVIPNMDDCITLLLHTDDIQHGDLKEKGHMYLRDSDMEEYSVKSIKESLCKTYGMEFGTSIFGTYFQDYTNVDMIDTGVYDCYSETFVAEAQDNADLIRCALDYVPGSNLILEKLVSGRWDAQFVVFEAGETVQKTDFHIGV